MKLRIVHILLDSGEYETLAASLPPSFKTDEIRELYRQRWAIETSFMFIKYHIPSEIPKQINPWRIFFYKSRENACNFRVKKHYQLNFVSN